MGTMTVTVTTDSITEHTQVIPAGPDSYMVNSILLSNIAQYQDIVKVDDGHVTSVVARSGRTMVMT